MNRLGHWQFGFAAAATFSVFYAVCALAVVLFPDGTIGFFNTWFHGLDVSLLKPPGGRPLTLIQFFYGLVGVAVVSFAFAATLAGVYNLFVRASIGKDIQVGEIGRYAGLQ